MPICILSMVSEDVHQVRRPDLIVNDTAICVILIPLCSLMYTGRLHGASRSSASPPAGNYNIVLKEVEDVLSTAVRAIKQRMSLLKTIVYYKDKNISHTT